MSGLYVPLDVEYWHDEKIAEAGKDGYGDPLAELLFVRALTFCKRTRNDGRIKRSQIEGFALRIPQPMKRWQYLVDTGAVIAVDDGYVIPAWLKRNKAAAEIGNKLSNASAFANHTRHHTNKGIVKDGCKFCADGGSVYISDSDSESEHVSDSDSLHKGEVEGRDREGKGELSSSENNSRPPLALVDNPDDDDFHATVELIVDARCEGRTFDKSERGYRAKVRAEARDLDGDTIRRLLASGDTPTQVAQFVLGYGHSTAAETKREPVAWCSPGCVTCDGVAWVPTPDGLVPCPERTTQATA